MKISRNWLQKYFEPPLPETAVLADALTFHAFEIESVENDILDVKVTANRGHDCLSHRGIAREFSAILQIPMKNDGFRKPVILEPPSTDISVYIEDPALCARFTGCSIKNIRVGPSPEWLRVHLESIGQRSINNIVDATNFVMFDLGQPLHAFDAGKLSHKSGRRSLIVRKAKSGERLSGLDDREYTLDPSMLVIADAYSGSVASIAGIKGGKQTGVDLGTIDLFLEAANWDGVTIRRASQALKLRTDASSRFEQVMSPEIAAYGIRAAADLIVKVAGGEVAGFVDEYPQKQQQKSVSVDGQRINAILGSKLADTGIAGALTRLDLPFTKLGDAFVVEPPFERLDLSIPEDIAEEVGRIIGYDKIPSVELPPLSTKLEVNANFFAAERARKELIAKGYSEVFTSIFADRGERVVANKVDGVRPYLRTTLVDGLRAALERNHLNKDLLGLNDVKLFEIGTVWKGGKELIMLATADEICIREEPLKNPQGDALRVFKKYEDLPLSRAQRFQPFSKYPFIVRDVALWISGEMESGEVEKTIRESAGSLLQRIDLFDRFEKAGRTSLAFRLVFQSFDRTLTDFDANERMGSISQALKAKGFEIR